MWCKILRKHEKQATLIFYFKNKRTSVLHRRRGKKIWLLISTLATWGKLIPVSLKRALDVFRCLPRLVHQILRCNLAFRGGCFVSATRVSGRGCNIFTVIDDAAWQQQVNQYKRIIYFFFWFQSCVTVNLIINSLTSGKGEMLSTFFSQ